MRGHRFIPAGVAAAILISGIASGQTNLGTPLRGRQTVGSRPSGAPISPVRGMSAPSPAVVFVGSWYVGDGPVWSSNPAVLSARDAAALFWGGSPTDYAISTVSSNPAEINFMAFVDGWADDQYLSSPVSQDFKVDSGAPGYNDPEGGPAYSAWVLDHSCMNRYGDPAQTCGPGEPGLNFAFRVTPTTIGCADWVSEVGTWKVIPPCGNVSSTAMVATYESESYSELLGDFTYEVELTATRPIQPTAANTLFVRGAPTPRGSAQVWNTGYAFNISMNGKYSVFRYSRGKPVLVQAWVTPSPQVINGSGLANTLRVEANGGTLTFVINGTPVKTITGQTLLSGQVGVGMVRSMPTGAAGPKDMLIVDAATVTAWPTGLLRKVSAAQERANAAANADLSMAVRDPFFAGGKY